MLFFSSIDSPYGSLLLTSDGRGLSGLYPANHPRPPSLGTGWRRADSYFTGVKEQLDAYFAGKLMRFDVTLSPNGSAFQRSVWDALVDVKFGETLTYGELAARLGQPTASRAVGLANSRNPISIIVPCHRIIGADGSLTGYAGGLEMKQSLLRHEAAVRDRVHFALVGAPAVVTSRARS